MSTSCEHPSSRPNSASVSGVPLSLAPSQDEACEFRDGGLGLGVEGFRCNFLECSIWCLLPVHSHGVIQGSPNLLTPLSMRGIALLPVELHGCWFGSLLNGRQILNATQCARQGFLRGSLVWVWMH